MLNQTTCTLFIELLCQCPMKQSEYGKLPTGETIQEFALSNENGMTVNIINYGGIITELHVPDKNGKTADVVLGLKNLEDYVSKNDHFFGCITGRVAGRISSGKFSLDGVDYEMLINDEPNHLHGGAVGLNKRVWTPKILDDNTLQLSYLSPDGEEGYPGNLEIAVTYSLNNENELKLDYHAKSDRSTPLCLTNHSYFNLAGEDSGEINDQKIQILCDQFVSTDEFMTLLGRAESVEGKGNDLRDEKTFKDAIPGLLNHHGDNYIVKTQASNELVKVARAVDPESGRVMETFTTDNCLQFYTGVSLDKDDYINIGKSGTRYRKHFGFCLECQGYPDGANSRDFIDNVLEPGDSFQQSTIYRFSTEH